MFGWFQSNVEFLCHLHGRALLTACWPDARRPEVSPKQLRGNQWDHVLEADLWTLSSPASSHRSIILERQQSLRGISSPTFACWTIPIEISRFSLGFF